MNKNQLVVAQGLDNPALFHSHCRVTDLHWISGTPDDCSGGCSAKIRYRQQDTPCQCVGLDNDRAIVEFSQPQRAITPGQALVLYRGEQCLGGGTIEQAYNP
jgi:tRNA-specific 2-thiouridylase